VIHFLKASPSATSGLWVAEATEARSGTCAAPASNLRLIVE